MVTDPADPLMAPDPQFEPNPFRVAVQNLTVLAALIAYASLAVYWVWRTWSADDKAPDVPVPQSATIGALAVALGAGYAALLGVPPQKRETRDATKGFKSAFSRFWKWLNRAGTGGFLLGLGALLYLIVGMLIGATYILNEGETPAVLRTIAVAFGGYVLAYLGSAYQRLAEE